MESKTENTTKMTEPRRLKGHKATTTCCIASRDRPGLIATAAEDGSVCWHDMRCKDVLFTMDVGNNNPISSLCFKTGNEDIIYVSVGNEVKCFDVHLADSWKPLESYNYNKDEINQIACNAKSSFLAAADDSGDVKIVDIQQKRLHKSLRTGHTSVSFALQQKSGFLRLTWFLLCPFRWLFSFFFLVFFLVVGDITSPVLCMICSSVRFLPWRMWEVITGGLDSKLVLWDFSKGRPQKIVDFGMPEMGSRSNMGQCLNPAFVHALAVPEVDMVDKLGKICVVARGDGAVNVLNIESELAALKPKNSSKSKKGGSTSKKGATSAESQADNQDGRKLHLDYSLGGHTAAVSCVEFSMFGEKGKFIISGGNDKSVKVWDWSESLDAGQTSSDSDLLRLSLNLSRKVNWLCTTPTDSENLVVCDTSKVVKVYSVG